MQIIKNNRNNLEEIDGISIISIRFKNIDKICPITINI